MSFVLPYFSVFPSIHFKCNVIWNEIPSNILNTNLFVFVAIITLKIKNKSKSKHLHFQSATSYAESSIMVQLMLRSCKLDAT